MTKKINAVIAVILVLAILVVILNSFRAENAPYVKYTARVGTYVISSRAEALVVRNETIVEPTITGVMEPVVAEGERVSAYSRLGAVITGNIDQARINELNYLNSEIDSLTNSISAAGILAISDDKVDSTLELSLSNLTYSASKNDTGTAIVLCDNIRILTERKAGVTSNSIAQERLNELTAQRDAIANSLGGAHRALYAPISGLYSDNMDGLEKVLTDDIVKSITPEMVDSYFEQTQSSTPSGPCKIINNYKWHIVFNLNNDDAQGLTVGKEYPVKFIHQGEKELKGKVTYISEPSEDGRYAVSMQFDDYIDDFTSIRVVDVEICKEQYSGIYIPRSAISVENGIQGVWVQNEVSLVFRSIVEVYRSDDFVLVDANAKKQGSYNNIELYDNIVLNPNK